MTSPMTYRSCAAVLCLALVPAIGHAQDRSLCEDLHDLKPGEQVTTVDYGTYAHVGLGWFRGPGGSSENGTGPVREVAGVLYRVAARRMCSPEGDYQVA